MRCEGIRTTIDVLCDTTTCLTKLLLLLGVLQSSWSALDQTGICLTYDCDLPLLLTPAYGIWVGFFLKLYFIPAVL